MMQKTSPPLYFQSILKIHFPKLPETLTLLGGRSFPQTFLMLGMIDVVLYVYISSVWCGIGKVNKST